MEEGGVVVAELILLMQFNFGFPNKTGQMLFKDEMALLGSV